MSILNRNTVGGNLNINLKNDDTTASSGQSSNSQMNKLGKPKDKTRKLSKVRSRHFTADKRNRMKQDEEDENREENKSMIEEEKKLWNDNNAFPEEIREYKPSQKDNSYFFSELEKDVEDEEQEDEDDEYAEEVEDPDNQNNQEQSNWFDQEINEDEDEEDEFTRELKVI